jgi:hypothetical protein
MTEEEVLGLKAPSGVEQIVDKNLEASGGARASNAMMRRFCLTARIQPDRIFVNTARCSLESPHVRNVLKTYTPEVSVGRQDIDPLVAFDHRQRGFARVISQGQLQASGALLNPEDRSSVPGRAVTRWRNPRLANFAGCKFTRTLVWFPNVELLNSSQLQRQRGLHHAMCRGPSANVAEICALGLAAVRMSIVRLRWCLKLGHPGCVSRRCGGQRVVLPGDRPKCQCLCRSL